MTAYRLIEIDDAGGERGIGIIDTLTMPPDATLIVSLSPDVLDVDLARINVELRAWFNHVPAWQKVPVLVIRAGDVRFLRLVPETSEWKPAYSTIKTNWDDASIGFNCACGYSDLQLDDESGPETCPRCGRIYRYYSLLEFKESPHA
jgi:hypothetical protein